jgi:hypothetical protein
MERPVRGLIFKKRFGSQKAAKRAMKRAEAEVAQQRKKAQEVSDYGGSTHLAGTGSGTDAESGRSL